jgi:hypothetical protein
MPRRAAVQPPRLSVAGKVKWCNYRRRTHCIGPSHRPLATIARGSALANHRSQATAAAPP